MFYEWKEIASERTMINFGNPAIPPRREPFKSSGAKFVFNFLTVVVCLSGATGSSWIAAITIAETIIGEAVLIL